jgi:NAD(P)-dependent dehydrogenase (short-subunit alcohol dehydrogenase family)
MWHRKNSTVTIKSQLRPKTTSLRQSAASLIVITGVTRGLGRAMVDEFIRLGHKVIGCARTRSAIDELTVTYPEHDFQVVDVASDRAVGAWAQRLLKTYGPPDFVLNNAAIINFKASLWEVDYQEFSNELDVNIKGVANIVRHFAPTMICHRHGVFVNFISRWGTRFEKQMAPYCATKWAVVALTRVLAAELKPEGVAAVGLNPGVVRTAMFDKYSGYATLPNLSNYMLPFEWAHIAVPYILRLCLKDTGRLRNVLTPQRLAARVIHGRHNEKHSA